MVQSFVLEMTGEEGLFTFPDSLCDALEDAKQQSAKREKELSDAEELICSLTPECDKIDYFLAAGSGVLCGIIDIFLVGKPGNSPFGTLSDQWAAKQTIRFAKRCGYRGKTDSLPGAIQFLEKKFKVNYDQTSGGPAFRDVLNLTAKNHHYKSLGHNPTALGLFFSVLDQFTGSSHFVSDGALVSLKIPADPDGFQLQGTTVPQKLFYGFLNWFGHLISDRSGSYISASNGSRGMGIPSPIWAFSNGVIALKNKLNLPVNRLNLAVREIGEKLFEEGYDNRFQTAQAIPVFINELLTRFFYTFRRILRYFSETPAEERSFSAFYQACNPFTGASVKRMLTVAHGSFCLLDVGDAAVRAAAHGNGVEFFLRLNLVGVGRFTISLCGEISRKIHCHSARESRAAIQKNRRILEQYLAALEELAEWYNDRELAESIRHFKACGLYREMFLKTAELSLKRGVAPEKVLQSKADIDRYFKGGNQS